VRAFDSHGGDQDNPKKEMSMSEKKQRRGFAAMDPEKQREIAKRGGIAAHACGSAHEFTREEAGVAGKKGGETISSDREHMARIGRLGGEVRRRRAEERRKAAGE
jgi:general stress protein YciG